MKACWHGGVLRLRLGGACAVKQGREKVAHVRHGWQRVPAMKRCGDGQRLCGEDDHASGAFSWILHIDDEIVNGKLQ